MKPLEFKNNVQPNTGFKIPEGYFEAFENKMMHQIFAKDTAIKNTVLSLFHKKYIGMSGIAAVFIVALAIPLYFTQTQITSLESSTIEQYLTQQQNISTTEIIPHLSDEDILKLTSSLGISATESNDIENYLSESENLEYIINN
jgi:cell division protein FtsL